MGDRTDTGGKMNYSYYVEAPAVVTLPRPWLFLAGGISGVADWQTKAKEMLLDGGKGGGTLLNPRRSVIDMEDPNVAKEQICWEYNHLGLCDSILFWFQEETVQPIALFELGRWSAQLRQIFVGVHPNYPRRLDVEVQMELVRKGMPIYYDLRSLCQAVLDSTTTLPGAL